MSAPAPLHSFTADEDTQIVLQRSAGKSCRVIGKSLGLSTEAIQQRYAQLMTETKARAAQPDNANNQ